MARFDEEIASKLDITTNEAESLRLRLQRDESVEDSTRQLVTDALVSAAEQLAKELSLCLRYHTVTFRGKRVERAMVAGGGAMRRCFWRFCRVTCPSRWSPPTRSVVWTRGRSGQ